GAGPPRQGPGRHPDPRVGRLDVHGSHGRALYFAIPPPRKPTLFPYTTLFRSHGLDSDASGYGSWLARNLRLRAKRRGRHLPNLNLRRPHHRTRATSAEETGFARGRSTTSRGAIGSISAETSSIAGSARRSSAR